MGVGLAPARLPARVWLGLSERDTRAASRRGGRTEALKGSAALGPRPPLVGLVRRIPCRRSVGPRPLGVCNVRGHVEGRDDVAALARASVGVRGPLARTRRAPLPRSRS